MKEVNSPDRVGIFDRQFKVEIKKEKRLNTEDAEDTEGTEKSALSSAT